MSRQKVAREIAKKLAVSEEAARLFLSTVLEEIKTQTAKRGRLTLAEFGSFSATKHKDKNRYNPQTKKHELIEGKWRVKFHSSPAFDGLYAAQVEARLAMTELLEETGDIEYDDFDEDTGLPFDVTGQDMEDDNDG